VARGGAGARVDDLDLRSQRPHVEAHLRDVAVLFVNVGDVVGDEQHDAIACR